VGIYLKESHIAVDTPVGQSETLCVLQVGQLYLKKNPSEKLCEYCWIYMLWSPVDKTSDIISSYILFLRQIITLRQINIIVDEGLVFVCCFRNCMFKSKLKITTI